MDHDFYTKEYGCKICGHTYTALRPRQRACVPLKRETDFNVIYQSLPCLFYEVVVCPACGYSTTGTMADPSAAARKIYTADIAPRWQSRDLNGVRDAADAMTCFKLAILCAQIQGERASVLAALELHLAWVYRTLGDQEQEERFMTMALNDYQTAYAKEDLRENGREITIAYLIGELSRRLGKPEQALRMLNAAISHPAAATKPQVIAMAREQWRLIRDQQQAASKTHS